MTLHFRGIPDFDTNEWTAICGTSDKPVRGELTTEAYRVTCSECRRVLRMNPRLDVDESERRFP